MRRVLLMKAHEYSAWLTEQNRKQGRAAGALLKPHLLGVPGRIEMEDEVPAPPSMTAAVRAARAGRPLPGSLQEHAARLAQRSMSPEQRDRTRAAMRARLSYDHMEEGR
jgi:hypothetical protein